MRSDLLALTPDALAALTNRGLLKRATREVEQSPPAVEEDAAGTVRATFADGTVTVLPPGGLDAGTCGCGAPGACRHVVGLVLAYQAVGTGGDVVDWSPGAFTDDQLTARIGARLVAAARRVQRAGYVARVHRPGPADPVPHVELPTATVRFLVPQDLGFVQTDAVHGARDDVIALAVWAFRAADRQAPGVPEVQLQVGGEAAGPDGSGLDGALALAGVVLREGAVHVGAGLSADIADVRRTLDAANLRWPLLAVEELVEQLDAYRDRSARYRPGTLADLVAELHARHRAVVNGGASLRLRVLGTDESAETPMRRARLDGLGCRVSVVGAERVVDVFYAHADSATVLVLRRSWETGDDGPALARRRVAGVTVGALAAGNVVTESAVRSANRTIRLAASRLSRTEAMPSRGAWHGLPRPLVADDVTALGAELDALPPRAVRPRVAAELVRVLPIAEVHTISYAPGDQRLDAVVADAAGTTMTVTATHASCAPGRLDTVAAALAGAFGTPRYVSGTVRRGGGGVLVDPLGFAVDDALVVPDLAVASAAADPVAGSAVPDALGAAVDAAYDLLGEVAHRGLAHLPSTVPERLREVSRRLAAVGLRRVAASVEAFTATLGPDPGAAATDAWVDAYLRVGTAAELR